MSEGPVRFALVTINFLNKGLYTVPEASRLIGVSPQWSWRVVRGREQRSNPVFTADFQPRGRADGFVSFLDMVELLFIDRFRKHGVSIPTGVFSSGTHSARARRS